MTKSGPMGCEQNIPLQILDHLLTDVCLGHSLPLSSLAEKQQQLEPFGSPILEMTVVPLEHSPWGTHLGALTLGL